MELVHEELTPAQKQAWEQVMSLMTWTAPGFTHLWYKLLSHNPDGSYLGVMTKQVPVAATDGKNVIFNPDTFFSPDYTLPNRVFIAAHEIVHNVYGDVELLHRMQGQENVTCSDGKVFPYKNDIMQKAMDYRINALLVESKIGHLPKDALYDPDIAKGKDGLFDIYGKVYKHDEDNGGGQGNPGPGNGQPNPGAQSGPNGTNGFDQVLPPGSSTGQSPGDAAQQRSPEQWAVEIAAAQNIEAQKSQGKGKGALQKMFEEILEPKVPWQDHIKTIINRRCGGGNYDWRRPDRRFIVRDVYLPSRSGHGAGWLVIWGDTSGSRSDREIERSLGEIAGIVEDFQPRRVTVIWGDDGIHNLDEVYDAADIQNIAHRGVGGRGGTDVEPVFEWIADQHEDPDMFLGFTDGYLSFPAQPAYPVVWASSTNQKYPYGEVVRVEN
jgi:predicted metal-dependent peptidase